MKYDVLKILKDNEDNFISGTKISKMLNVSRTQIWKYILELKNIGYIIESSSNKGYKLIKNEDMYNDFEIKYKMSTNLIGNEVMFFETLDSTNTYAKILAQKEFENGTVIVADQQNMGRGRLGRTWSSVKGKGIWMSILLKPDIIPSKIQIITLAAAVSIVRAIKELYNLEVKIKWPNDILLDGKKLSGILTEMSCSIEEINYLVLGIGININHISDDFPFELRDIATSIRKYYYEKFNIDKIFSRSDIIKKVLISFEEIYKLITEKEFDVIINEWRVNSCTLGKKIEVNDFSKKISGIALDIDDEGRLIFKKENGEIINILSGEVSLN